MKENEPKHPLSEETFSPGTIKTYTNDGVDLSLIRWMLSMTPTQRLQTLQKNIRSVMRLRGEKPTT
jgi:hypothetical protein